MTRAAILSVLLALAPALALGGAWTRAPGETFLSNSIRYFSTELSSGDEDPFRRVSTQAYVEHGLTDRVTIGGELTFGQRGDGRQEGVARGFARLRLWRGDAGDSLSVQVGGEYPVFDVVTPLDVTRDVTGDARVGIAYGRGYVSDWGNGWLEANLTLRHRQGAPADEARLDLTAGIRPNDDWVAFAQIFGALGLRNEGFDGADFDVAKLSLSVGRKITERRTLLFSVTQDVIGRNLSLGSEAAVTIWTKF